MDYGNIFSKEGLGFHVKAILLLCGFRGGTRVRFIHGSQSVCQNVAEVYEFEKLLPNVRSKVWMGSTETQMT